MIPIKTKKHFPDPENVCHQSHSLIDTELLRYLTLVT